MLAKKKKFRKDHLGKVREIHKESLADTLKRVVEKDKLFNFKENTVDPALFQRWVEIVGKNLANLTVLKPSKTGVLTIEAKNSVVIQEIKLMQKEILNQLKSGLPVYIFKQITIKLKL